MRFIAVLFGLILPLFACAESSEDAKPKKVYEEGKHYTIIQGAVKPSKTDTVEVTEVFWYGCGHCYKFEKPLHKWLESKPDFIEFTQSPAMWKQRRPGVPADLMWTHAKMFYAAKAVQGLDKLHPAFFEAMHKDRNMLLNDEAVAKVVTKAGFDGENFVGVMNSFAVTAQINQADERQRRYKISGTPEIVVGDYYHVSATKAGGQKAMLEVATYLAGKLKK